VYLNKGVALALASAFLFSAMDVFVKLASKGVPSGEIVFVRSVIDLIVIFFIMRKKGLGFTKKDLPDLLLRGLCGGGSMCLTFLAISGMPLGDVSILTKLDAFFVLLLSVFWLKESIPDRAGIPLCVIALGACLVVKPWHLASLNAYSFFAIASAFLASMAYTTIHKLFAKGGHNTWEIMSYLFFFSAAIGAAQMPGRAVWPTWSQWGLLAGVAFFSLMAQACMTVAYKLTNQVLVSFIRYLGIFLNIFWGFVLFGEKIDPLSCIGGVLIILSSMVLGRMRRVG